MSIDTSDITMEDTTRFDRTVASFKELSEADRFSFIKSIEKANRVTLSKEKENSSVEFSQIEQIE
jgi:hypothetical protein